MTDPLTPLQAADAPCDAANSEWLIRGFLHEKSRYVIDATLPNLISLATEIAKSLTTGAPFWGRQPPERT